MFEVDAPEPVRTSFYTALYHAMHGARACSWTPTARYRGPDNAVHHADGFGSTTRPSRCGTPIARCIRCSRCCSPAAQQRYRAFAARRARGVPYGILPVWAYQGLETWCMIGYHAVPVIADAT